MANSFREMVLAYGTAAAHYFIENDHKLHVNLVILHYPEISLKPCSKL